uniref:Prp18 domain-containing protein n=1 Tax=Mesocestoides corti TaxID=53468 RepID=A0A5K3ESX6_MESCO
MASSNTDVNATPDLPLALDSKRLEKQWGTVVEVKQVEAISPVDLGGGKDGEEYERRMHALGSDLALLTNSSHSTGTQPPISLPPQSSPWCNGVTDQRLPSEYDYRMYLHSYLP